MQALHGQMKQNSLLSHEAAGELSFFKQALQPRIGRKLKPIIYEEIYLPACYLSYLPSVNRNKDENYKFIKTICGIKIMEKGTIA